MAATYWHLYVADQFIDSLQTQNGTLSGIKSILKHRDCFLAGTQGPDLNFFPGGNSELSHLSHGSGGRPADLGRDMLSIASNDKEKAYAYGWLMHLATDIITHPLVHKLMTETFPGKCKPGTDVSSNVIEHRRVEWGIDSYIVEKLNLENHLPDLSTIIQSAEDLVPFIQASFLKTHQSEVSSATWHKAMEGTIKSINMFRSNWERTGRIHSSNSIVQFGKSFFYYLFFLPMIKGLSITRLANTLSVFIPVFPSESQIKRIEESTQRTCESYRIHLAENFKGLENRTE